MVNYFFLLELLILLSAILIVLVKNPMLSIYFLLVLFLGLSLYLYSLNIKILALLYLLIYVGSISVLFLFILSLFSAIFPSTNYKLFLNSSFPISIILIISAIFYYYISYPNTITVDCLWIPNTYDFNHWEIIGYLLYTEYSILMIFLGILLLFSISSVIILSYI